MRLRFSLLILTLAAGQAVEPVHQLDVKISMRDGVRLAANVYRPPGVSKAPALLVRTPYNKGTELLPGYKSFVDRGYAVIVQDVRGRYASEGVFRPLEQEPKDGYDTLDWLARQPWCDGNIGMMGGSYLGIVQWKVALLNHPNLKAISPVVSGYDDYRDRFYSTGGALKLGGRLQWMRENLRVRGYQPPEFDRFIFHLPLRTIDRLVTGETSEMMQRALDHPAYDTFWQKISTRDQIARIQIPVLSFGGWYDNFAQSDLEAFTAVQANGGTIHTIIGPWPHNMSIKFPAVDFGPDSGAPVRAMQIEWFDRWLRGKRLAQARAPLRIFVMGENRWREENEWPLARANATPYYLHSKGILAANPPGREKPDRYTYDPANPAPTVGGAVCCNPKVFPWGPIDQRTVETRPDILSYTSAVLAHDVEVTGPVKLILYLATTAPDTDFTAKLVDVFPDGSARNLTDGILRLRYRDSIEKPALAKPGESYRVTIDAGVTSNVFLKGHRIRLEVSSSNFPRFDRNPNTGRSIANETELRKAEQTVYHDRTRPSHLVLPVVD